MASSSRFDWESLIADFTSRESTTPRDLAALKRFLDPALAPERIPVTTPLLPIDEAEERAVLIRDIQEVWQEDFAELTGLDEKEYEPLHPIILATLMVMDIVELRLNTDDMVRIHNLLSSLHVIPSFVKICMTKTPSDEDNQAAREFALPMTRYLDKRLDNDRCIILGTGNPQICHIVPWSANSEESHRARMHKLFPAAISVLFPRDVSRDDVVYNRPDEDVVIKNNDIDVGEGSTDEDDFVTSESKRRRKLPYRWKLQLDYRLYFSSKVSISDRAWNAVGMNKLYHAWWGAGYFALKPVSIVSFPPQTGRQDDEISAQVGGKGKEKDVQQRGTTYLRIKLQCHWMPRRKEDSKGAPPLDIENLQTPDQVQSMLGKTYGDADPGNPVWSEHQRLSMNDMTQTGDIFYVTVKLRHVYRMFLAFKLQWHIIKVFSLAGGAEALDDVDDDPKYLNADLVFPGMAINFAELLKA